MSLHTYAMSFEVVYGTIKKILFQREMLMGGVPVIVDMHWASAAIVLKFNGRQLCLVFNNSMMQNNNMGHLTIRNEDKPPISCMFATITIHV